jgi:ribosomal protein S2
MKLNKIKVYKNKILRLKLIQTKIYKKNYNNFIKIEDISSRLKKALHVIYSYHINNKRILFIGTPIQIASKFKKLLKNTKHVFIPGDIWMSGILTNQESCFKYLSKNPKSVKNKISEILFQLKKQSDLIVVLDFFSNKEAISEAYLARIPIISLNCDLKILDNNSNYKIPGNFKFAKKKVRNLFFYSILTAIFKKTPKI